MKFRFVCVLSILMLPGLALCQDVSPGNKYLKVQVANERLNSTLVLLGQVKGNSIFFMKEDRSIEEVKFSSVGEGSITQSDRPARSTDLSKVSLNFEMSKAQVARCERLPEFKTFLSQLALFKVLVNDFEVTAGSKAQAECAAKIVQMIVNQGYAVQISYGNLTESGISARAYMDGEARASMADSREARYVLELSFIEGRKSDILVNSAGFFLYSFQAQPNGAQLTVFHRGSRVSQIPIGLLPRFELGESKIAALGAQSISVTKFNFDTISLDEIPDGVLNAAVEEQLRRERMYTMALGWRARYYQAQGTGLPGTPSGIVPLELYGYNSLTRKFFIEGEASLPFNLTGTLPTLTRMSAALNHWFVGEEKRGGREIGTLRWGLGLGGFFFRQAAKKKNEGSGSLLLTDLLGINFSQTLSLLWDDKWETRLRLDLSPIPQAQAYESSLSYQWSVLNEYCTSLSSCWNLDIRGELIDIRLVQLGVSDFSSNSLALGYKLTFE